MEDIHQVHGAIGLKPELSLEMNSVQTTDVKIISLNLVDHIAHIHQLPHQPVVAHVDQDITLNTQKIYISEKLHTVYLMMKLKS